MHGFCQKIEFFSYWYFLGKISRKRVFFDILDRKECFLDQKSEIINNSEKSKFSKGVSSRFSPKIRMFSHVFFFFGQLKQEKFVFGCSR